VLVAPWTEPVGEPQEVGLVDGVEYLHGSPLDDLVLQNGYPDGTLSAVCLGYIHPFDRLGPVDSTCQTAREILEVGLQVSTVLPPSDVIFSGRRLRRETPIGLPKPIHVVDVVPE
jgi:hypothetical protein